MTESERQEEIVTARDRHKENDGNIENRLVRLREAKSEKEW